MKLRTAPALNGLLWVRDGVRLALRYPLQYLSMVLFMMATLGLLMWLPFIGTPLAFAALPAFTAGWVFSSHAAALGMAPSPGQFIAVFRSMRRPAFALLGALQAAAALVVLGIADLLDPNTVDQWDVLVAGQNNTEATANAALDAVQAGLAVRAAMLIPVALVFWHAPVILMRTRDSVAKALFASIMGSVRNLGAFVVYGAGWVLADLLLSVVIGLLLAALGLAQYSLMVALPGALLLTAAFYASLHASVEGCLVIEPAQPAEAASENT